MGGGLSPVLIIEAEVETLVGKERRCFRGFQDVVVGGEFGHW